MDWKVSDVTEVPAPAHPTCDHLHGDADAAGDQSGGRDGDVASHEERKAASVLVEEEAVVVEVEVNRRRRLSRTGRKMRWCRIGLDVAGSNGGNSMKNCDVLAVV
jgi:hypothetical protein